MKKYALLAFVLLIGISKGFCKTKTHEGVINNLIENAEIYLKVTNKVPLTEMEEIRVNFFIGFVYGVISSHNHKSQIPVGMEAIKGVAQNIILLDREAMMGKTMYEIVIYGLREYLSKSPTANSDSVPNESPTANSDSVPNNDNEFPITFSDKYGIWEIQILEILKGQEIADRGKCFNEDQPKVASKNGKKLVHFFVKVTNKRYEKVKYVSVSSFQLESVEGEVSEQNITKDKIQGNLGIGRSCRGGVMFDYYNDLTPKTLIFDTGLTENNERFYAKSPDLSKFFK